MTTPAPVTPIAHPSFFQTVEAKFAHGVSVVMNGAKQASAEVQNVLQNAEAEIAILEPELAPFLPQIAAAMVAVRPFLAQLLAELKAVEAIPVQPAA